jgi:hypothetical protein
MIKKRILEIIKTGEELIKPKRNALNLVCVFLAIFMTVLKVHITENLLGVLISSLAIFSGFFFTLIVYITDKSVNKIEQLNAFKATEKTNISFDKFRLAYIAFSKSVVNLISYSILQAIFLIIVAFTTQVKLFNIEVLDSTLNLTEISRIIFTFLFCGLSMRMLYFILLIITKMNAFFQTEINQVHNHYK